MREPTHERQTIDRGWFYVLEPDGGARAPADARIVAEDGAVLTRRLHGHPGRVDVVDEVGGLPAATLLRVASAVGRAQEDAGQIGRPTRVTLGPAGTEARGALDDAGHLTLTLDGAWARDVGSHHPVDAAAAALIAAAPPPSGAPWPPEVGPLPERAVPRAMFFESLMNTDMPHNDKEISQGVLHMISGLPALGTEVVLVNAKMPIVGDDRPVHGLEHLVAALAGGRVGLVCVTLLEGYWQGVQHLIRTLRGLGCRAHIAVGGVMPSLAPEHVAAHLPEVSFVCRGAGEVFVPRLAQILGDADVDTPFTPAQRAALLDLDGMITLERAALAHGGGLRLLAARCDRTRVVDDLDRVELDLRFVEKRHIEGGIEISSSRGCIHKCSFCSILGRESYQARSAGGLFDVLDAYERRFAEMGRESSLPPDRYRMHLSDDDFACDRPRAMAFFERLARSRWRMSSVQVSIADLCRKEGGKLLLEPDHALLDTMKAEIFADHHRAIPKADFYEDHKSRDWQSFLQIGVETYADREITRLGKGYKLAHVRLIVGELARRSLHMDGYFILSNAETTPDDLVDVFSEVSRLKLRWPRYFHMRFPVVQHLVSYFTSASHRRHVRMGRRHVLQIRDFAAVPGHAELDYPFVDHDVPMDPIVAATVERSFVTDDGLYTGNLAVLRGLWLEQLDALPPDHADVPRLRRLLRLLDDRPRRLVFDMLRQALSGDDEGWPDARLDKIEAVETAERVLGPQAGWIRALKHQLRSGRARRVVVDGQGLAPAHAAEVVVFLAATDLPERALHVARADAAQIAAWRDDAERQGVAVSWILDADHTPPSSWRDADTLLVVRDDGAPAPDLCGRAHQAIGVARATPGRPDALAHAARALLQGGVRRLAIELDGATPWTDADAAALGRALFAVEPALRAASAQVREAGPDARSGVGVDQAIVAGGVLARWEGRDHAPRHTLGHLDALTGPDRHDLELVDPALVPDGPDARARHIARATKVLQSFLAWRARPSPQEAATAPGDTP